MVSEYNNRARALGLSAHKMVAVEGDILAGDEGVLRGEEFFGFDVVAVGLALHHMAEPERAVEKLVGRLRRGGGVLLVVELLPRGHGHGHGHEVGGHGAEHTISKHGFDREDMKRMIEGAGCEGFEMEEWDEPMVMEGKGGRFEVKAFSAKGVRKA